MKIETRNGKHEKRARENFICLATGATSAREMEISRVKKSRIISEENLARIPRRCLGWVTVGSRPNDDEYERRSLSPS